ncbi:hypothetical protein B0H14DRAFT_2646136 [Mycena olivaceomarginata]|nr:hypothetical protein B0H14DRAFT_2646136 [Mycena olivaceomarginata]
MALSVLLCRARSAAPLPSLPVFLTSVITLPRIRGPYAPNAAPSGSSRKQLISRNFRTPRSLTLVPPPSHPSITTRFTVGMPQENHEPECIAAESFAPWQTLINSIITRLPRAPQIFLHPEQAPTLSALGATVADESASQFC